MRKLIIVVTLMLLLLTLVLAVPIAASNGDGENGSITARALAMMIAGIVTPYLTQWLKKLFGGLEAKSALWVAFGVSVGVSVAALLFTGGMGWTPPLDEPVQTVTWFVEHVGVVFALATLVYHQFLSGGE